MIVGFCFYDNTVGKVFRKSDKYCSQCGQKLILVEASLHEDKKHVQIKGLD